jgi:mono/diheme cytochrome c family protein
MIKSTSRSALVLLVSFFLTGFVITNKLIAADGKAIFKQNCAVCHSLGDNKITGPGLKGVMDRVPKDNDWIFHWVKNAEKVIKSGDTYANKIYKENGTMMTVMEGTLSDDDVRAVIEYIKNPPPTPGSTPGGAAVASTSAETKEQAAGVNPLYILLAVIVILALLISILRGVRMSLRNITNKREGKEEEPARTFWEESVIWMDQHRRFMVVCFIIVVSIGTKSCWNSLFRIGVYYDWQTDKGYKPEQPIKFSHKIHAGDNAIACQYCHNSVEKSRHAGIPTVNVCMNCHKGISTGPTTGDKEIAKIYAAAGFDPKSGKYDESKASPIQWVKVHNLPDLVYFNHSQHVVVGKIECTQCHGNVKEMTVAEQRSPLTMKWCVECHRKTDVAMEGNPYYEKLHAALKEKYKGQHLNKFTVAQMGGIECAKCHY